MFRKLGRYSLGCSSGVECVISQFNLGTLGEKGLEFCNWSRDFNTEVEKKKIMRDVAVTVHGVKETDESLQSAAPFNAVDVCEHFFFFGSGQNCIFKYLCRCQ